MRFKETYKGHADVIEMGSTQLTVAVVISDRLFSLYR